MADLARALRDLRARAGGLPYQILAGNANYSAAVLADATSGNRCPTWGVTKALVKACHGQPDEFLPLWEAADQAWRATKHAERAGNVSPLPRRKAERRSAAPDPWKATTTAGFIHQLRALRAWGGSPGVKEVGRILRGAGGGSLSSSSFYDALSVERPKLPPLRLVQALVDACDGDVEQWTAAWRALRLADFNNANPAPAELVDADSGGADATVHPLRQRGSAS